jgi:hypothetical protein
VRSVRARLPNGMVMPNTDRDPTDLPPMAVTTGQQVSIDELVAEALELSDAATPGPWRLAGTPEKPFPVVSSFHETRGYQIHSMSHVRDRDQVGHVVFNNMLDAYNADAAFIARARTLVPQMAKAIVVLQSSLRAMGAAGGEQKTETAPPCQHCDGTSVECTCRRFTPAASLPSAPHPQHPPHGADDDYDYGAVLRELESDTALQPPHGDDSRIERWDVCSRHGTSWGVYTHKYAAEHRAKALNETDALHEDAAPFAVRRLVELRADEEIVDASTINQMLRARKLSSVPHPAGARSAAETDFYGAPRGYPVTEKMVDAALHTLAAAALGLGDSPAARRNLTRVIGEAIANAEWSSALAPTPDAARPHE